MKTLPFKKSSAASIGIELELQIINPKTQGLISRSKELIRNIHQTDLSERIKPEITQSMLEINSSIHSTSMSLQDEMQKIRNYLINEGRIVKVNLCGGGTHPFQKWSLQKIFPTMRYKSLASKFRYLSKRSTVFGQHIHIGCENGDDAIYLTHALSHFVPHFIAICASSPFYQGVDTGYYSSRSTVFNSFPLSGLMPPFKDWQEFTTYFNRMEELGIVHSMKDFYWDIRPKPEFGTVEIRVCDTPLTIKKSVQITAYVQALALYLLEERPIEITDDMFYLYGINRFQASRYGFLGEIVNFHTGKKQIILDDIMQTLKNIEPYANKAQGMGHLSQLINDIINKENDTVLLRKWMKQYFSFQKVVEQQCLLWAEE